VRLCLLPPPGEVEVEELLQGQVVPGILTGQMHRLLHQPCPMHHNEEAWSRNLAEPGLFSERRTGFEPATPSLGSSPQG